MSSTSSDKQPKPKELSTVNSPPITTPNLPFIRQNLMTTLQGHIHLVLDPSTQTPLIIKQTIKKLIELGISHNGNQLNENFIEEMRILTYLSSQSDIDKGICCIYNNYIWEDQYSYYYAMKYYPTDLFSYIRKQFIYFKTNPKMKQILLHNASNNIPYKPWINTVQHIFKQLVKSVDYLHSKGIAHMDLSLENIMLTNTNNKNNNNNNISTELIDFGVAYDIKQHNNSWLSSKQIGKFRYMSPEVAAKNVTTDCRSADIWSLGVILYTMLTHTAPYNKPFIIQDFNDSNACKNGDLTLTYLLNGQIHSILKKQNKLWMVHPYALDLLNKIFTLQQKRIKMEEILSHPFVGLTPPKYLKTKKQNQN